MKEIEAENHELKNKIKRLEVSGETDCEKLMKENLTYLWLWKDKTKAAETIVGLRAEVLNLKRRHWMYKRWQ